MTRGMTNGNQSRIFCRDNPAISVPTARITAFSSKRSYSVVKLKSHGGTFLNVSEIFSWFTPDFSLVQNGVWKCIFDTLVEDADNEYAMIDSTIVRVHQHGARAKKAARMRKPLVAAVRSQYQNSCDS